MKPKLLIADEASAICAKDIDRIVLLRPDVVFFDVKPPFQNQWCRCLAAWEECFALFPMLE